MNWGYWERIAPLDGIIAVCFWIVGVIVMSNHQPSMDSPAPKALIYFGDHSSSIILGAFLIMIGALFFFWFLGSLRVALRIAEGGEARVTGIAFAAGVATGTLLLLLPGAWFSAAANHTNLSAEAAQALFMVFLAVFVALEMAAVVFLLATAVVIFQTRVLSTWLAWTGLVVAIGLLILPIGQLVLLFLFPLWMIAASLALYRHVARPAAAAATMP
jgi:hypothetical protein